MLLLASCGKAKERARTEPIAAEPSARSIVPGAPAPLASAPAAPSSEPAPVIVEDPARAASASAERDHCLADAGCSKEEFARLAIVANDFGAATDCDLFYYGVGVPKSFARARGCYDRATRSFDACGSKCPYVELGRLGAMMISGDGGPRTSERMVRALVNNHLSDAQLEDILQGGDYCARAGRLTTTRDCVSLEDELFDVQRHLARKDLGPRIGADGLAKEAEAEKAFQAFVVASIMPARNGGEFTDDMNQAARHNLESFRVERLRALAGSITFASDADRLAAEGEAHDTFTALMAEPAEVYQWGTVIDDRHKHLQSAKTAFEAWKTAEIAFERAVVQASDRERAEVDAITRATKIWGARLKRIHEIES